jgi:exosortase F-associated protein
VINDILMLVVIHLWFRDHKITRIAFLIQVVDTLILLPIYLMVKLAIEGDTEISSPLLSQLHRLIINPTLMILIFPAVYFQRLNKITTK